MIRKVHEIQTGSRLIGIHGKAGSGKDTVCSYLHAKYTSCWRESFADPLKHAAAEAFGIPVEFFNDPDQKEITNDFWQTSPRKIAQFMGTEMFRNTIAQLVPDVANDFWVRRLTGKINCVLNGDAHAGPAHYDATDTIIVTDVRFQNEVDWIQENSGIVIHLHRSHTVNVGLTNHASEQQIVCGNAFNIVNDGTKEELYDRLDEFAKVIGLERKALSKFDADNF